MSIHAELPLPPHWEPARASAFSYAPDQQALFDAAVEWRRAHAIAPAARDDRDVHLLLIDTQRDFCFPEGSLYVAGRSGRGALDDNRRTAELIYRNLARLTHITTTLDTHHAFQIFFASFWVDADGEPLRPHREVTSDDVRSGRARPAPSLAALLTGGDERALEAHALHYTSELERAGKYRLYLWPPHCVLGSVGHTLAGVIHEARLFHSYTRFAQSTDELKGDNALTENYSVLRPEVLTRANGSALGGRNAALLGRLVAADAVVVAGQASSHCVMSSVDDLLMEIRALDARLARKVYLVTDCMSAVTVPDGTGGFAVDFTPAAEAALGRFADAGMHLVRSTEPMAGWPGMS